MRTLPTCTTHTHAHAHAYNARTPHGRLQLPPEMDVYALLAGPDAASKLFSPLDSEAVLRGWWAGLPRGRTALRSCAEQRLVAKVRLAASSSNAISLAPVACLGAFRASCLLPAVHSS